MENNHKHLTCGELVKYDENTVPKVPVLQVKI